MSSASTSGRQSPLPEEQNPSQGTSVPGSGKADGAAPSDSHSKDKSEAEKFEGLESNPRGPLEDAAAEKTKKTVGEHARGLAEWWCTWETEEEMERRAMPPPPVWWP